MANIELLRETLAVLKTLPKLKSVDWDDDDETAISLYFTGPEPMP